MKSKSKIYTFTIASLVILGALALTYYLEKDPQTSITLATPEQIQQGEKLFVTNCESCHGVKAVGENPEKPMGGEKLTGGYLAPALNGTGHGWHHPNEMLFRNIKEGSIAEDSAMKGFKDSLDDQEMIAILHYFQSLWPKRIMDRRNHNSN